MKKISFVLSATALLLSTNVNAMNCINHEAPFIGINTIDDKCCIVVNDTTGDKVSLGGSAKTNFAVNKNFALATCKVKLPDGFDTSSSFDSGRNQVINEIITIKNEAEEPVEKELGCHIGIISTGMLIGNGGFTIDAEEGVVNGNCKAER